MNRKIPPDAFSYYFSLGTGRSYQAVAEHYKVSKRAVSNMAEREDWQGRLADVERRARDKVDEKAIETLDEMNSRHLKVLRFIQNRAIEALKAMPIESAMDAVRAYGMTLDKERTIRGEPNERTAFSVEEVIRQEMRDLLVLADDENDGENNDGEAA